MTAGPPRLSSSGQEAVRSLRPVESADPYAGVPSVGELAANSDSPTAQPEDPLATWAPVDLGPYLAGEVARPVPTIGLARSDGLRLIYPGKEHTVIGEMECGKSWVLLACAASELRAGEHVAYVHFEESDPGDTVERLLALGVDGPTIRERLAFYGPEDRVTRERLATLLATEPSLVIYDGVNEGLTLHGLKINENEGAADFRRLLVKPCTATGAAVLSADHVPKSREDRGRSAIGGVHKVNAISGVVVLLENAEPFGRQMRGRSHVFVTKDRPGHLRRHGRPDRAVTGKTYLGELIVDDTQRWSADLTLRFHAPNDDAIAGETPDQPHDPTPGNPVADEVHAALTLADGQHVTSERKLLAAVRAAGYTHRDSAVRAAIEDLLLEHPPRVREISGPRGAKGYQALPTAAQDHQPPPRPTTAARIASASASPKTGGTRDADTARPESTASHRGGRSGTQTDADTNPEDTP